MPTMSMKTIYLKLSRLSVKMNSGKGSKSEVFLDLLKGGVRCLPKKTGWQYGYSGHFHKALFDAISDGGNLDRLFPGFLDEVSGYRKYTRQAGW